MRGTARSGRSCGFPGTVTLPAALREKYRLDEGDPLTVVDLDGAARVDPSFPRWSRTCADGQFGNTVPMGRARQTVLEVAGREVGITKPDKVFFPQAGYTK